MVTLRATVDTDLDAVAAAEVDQETRRWIGDTSREWHRAALDDSDREHMVMLSDDRVVGFAILAGLSDPHRSVELRRIVVSAEHRGQGLGKAAFRATVARAFGHGAHRVWLEVKETNHLAQDLYANEGFVREGLLRETLREPDGSWSSFVVMSQLETERTS
ncbi:MAG: GNAT family N-acetyltransferase [Actinophytocola sp.]|nr:GNAT family N-acetyltransferase [Actinophytocola sp.]